MLNEIKVGTRVRITEKYATPAEAHSAADIGLVGREGVVTEIIEEPWPVRVVLDGETADGLHLYDELEVV